MGLFNFFAKRGAIGGTARWAAETYIHFKKANLKANDREILKAMAEFRYSTIPIPINENKKRILLEDLSGEVQMKTLADFVFLILSAETDIAQTGFENIQKAYDVINEELEKHNIQINL